MNLLKRFWDISEPLHYSCCEGDYIGARGGGKKYAL